jgi:hypothetical protein
MKQRPRIYYTESQKALMWERWQKGDSCYINLSLALADTTADMCAIRPYVGVCPQGCADDVSAPTLPVLSTPKPAEKATSAHDLPTVARSLMVAFQTGASDSGTPA